MRLPRLWGFYAPLRGIVEGIVGLLTMAGPIALLVVVGVTR